MPTITLRQHTWKDPWDTWRMDRLVMSFMTRDAFFPECLPFVNVVRTPMVQFADLADYLIDTANRPDCP